MRKALVLLAILVCVAQGVFASSGAGGKEPPAEGSVLPEMKLPIPQKLDQQEYLGIKETESFKIPDIEANVVIIEVFSMYCPFCQKEAPNVNALQDLVSRRPDLSGRIKFIGIGAGNSIYEVNAFRNLYQIAFPLIPDANFAFHKALGEVRTPCFIVVQIDAKKAHKIIYSRVGSFGDPQQFLDLIMQKSGLDKRNEP